MCFKCIMQPRRTRSAKLHKTAKPVRCVLQEKIKCCRASSYVHTCIHCHQLMMLQRASWQSLIWLLTGLKAGPNQPEKRWRMQRRADPWDLDTLHKNIASLAISRLPFRLLHAQLQTRMSFVDFPIAWRT